MEIHWSQLSMFSRCGEQYRRRYIEKEIIPPGVALHVGTAVHKAVEKSINHKITFDHVALKDSILFEAVDALNKSWDEKGCVLEDATIGQKKARGDAVDEAVALAGLHYDEVMPKIKPVKAERHWVIDVKNTDVRLAGTIDIQEEDGSIRDTKTSGKSPSADAADKSDQLTNYALAVYALDGKIPPKLHLDFLVKNKTPKAVTVTTERDVNDLIVWRRRIDAWTKAIQSGVFMPAEQSSFWCSRRFCGYAETCPYFRGRIQG